MDDFGEEPLEADDADLIEIDRRRGIRQMERGDIADDRGRRLWSMRRGGGRVFAASAR